MVLTPERLINDRLMNPIQEDVHNPGDKEVSIDIAGTKVKSTAIVRGNGPNG